MLNSLIWWSHIFLNLFQAVPYSITTHLPYLFNCYWKGQIEMRFEDIARQPHVRRYHLDFLIIQDRFFRVSNWRHSCMGSDGGTLPKGIYAPYVQLFQKHLLHMVLKCRRNIPHGCHDFPSIMMTYEDHTGNHPTQRDMPHAYILIRYHFLIRNRIERCPRCTPNKRNPEVKRQRLRFLQRNEGSSTLIHAKGHMILLLFKQHI